MLRAVRTLLGRAIAEWVEGTEDDATYARRFNRANQRWGLPYRLQYDPSSRLWCVESNGSSIMAARRSRLRKVGDVEARRRQLRKVYLLDLVDLMPGDTVIDVGANIGEFSMLCTDEYGVSVVAFEPDLRDFAALSANAQGRAIEAHDRLLWSESSTVPYFDANDSADSSIFAPDASATSVPRTAVTLDAAISASKHKDGPIKLIKLEAEGAEPEVLIGASSVLERTMFITADLGPERGPEKDSTLVAASTILRDRGFDPIAFFAPRYVMLFRRASLSA